jgi:oligoendopeptidase F
MSVRWSLTAIYSGFESEEFKKDFSLFKEKAKKLEQLFEKDQAGEEDAEQKIVQYIQLFNEASDLITELSAYTYAQYTTDSYNQQAITKLNELEEAELVLKRARTAFRDTLRQSAVLIESLCREEGRGNELLKDYTFFLKEELRFARKQMNCALEDLAADLSRAGGSAWGRLQEVLTSQMKITWEKEEEKTLVQLRALAFHQDRKIREKAYRKELKLLEEMKVPLAYSINGVKGFSVILNKRRQYNDTLERTLLQSRLTDKALNALLSVMRSALPFFRRYLKAKAKKMGLTALRFYDIFAPVGRLNRKWSFNEAKDFILNQFKQYSPGNDKMYRFVKRAFDESWIDAEPRAGKVGGAYCISFPLSGQSRILMNFDNSYSSISTLAHELGHAYHHHVLKDVSSIHRKYPMTLAETASIFSENLVMHSVLEQLQEEEKIPVLEAFLQDSTQVIVDILSRFIFESEVMKIRKKRELSPDELCSIMEKAQKDTYGDALEEDYLHPYMWAVKSHYYNENLAYYNFPYAFGLLFGLGLFSLYQKDKAAFPDKYNAVLINTGRATAVDVTSSLGFNIEECDFWQSGIDVICNYIKIFEEL